MRSRSGASVVACERISRARSIVRLRVSTVWMSLRILSARGIDEQRGLRRLQPVPVASGGGSAGRGRRVGLDVDQLAVDGQRRAPADERAGRVRERLVVEDAAVGEAARAGTRPRCVVRGRSAPTFGSSGDAFAKSCRCRAASPRTRTGTPRCTARRRRGTGCRVCSKSLRPSSRPRRGSGSGWRTGAPHDGGSRAASAASCRRGRSPSRTGRARPRAAARASGCRRVHRAEAP